MRWIMANYKNGTETKTSLYSSAKKPVSYTHLDVYKRQIPDIGCCAEARPQYQKGCSPAAALWLRSGSCCPEL